MLAGVDYVLMGAGIPQSIPGMLDRLANGEVAELPLRVVGADTADNYVSRFDPAAFTPGEVPRLERPKFLAIVGSSTLATMLARKANGRVDGFVVEGPTAGGHNAPPRGKPQLSPRGEPVYGARDEVDLKAIHALQRPFWLAGAYGSPEGVVQALEAGATGVQVGTAFAFCNQSGLNENIRQRVLRMSRRGELDVFTDPVASPTGFPFKVLHLEGTLSEPTNYQQRQRGCDLGFLRQVYKKPDGEVGWRCPAERVESYVGKGGKAEDAMGRKCLCNGLLANVGLQQVRDGEPERPLVTCGDDVKATLMQLSSHGNASSYSAADVVRYLLKEVGSEKPSVAIGRN
jgi:nitronate monooxygenase